MTTLRHVYVEYIKTQVPDSRFEEDLSTNQYLCWSIPHKQNYTVHNWLGEYMGTGVIQSRHYIWLGSKGAVYVTKTSIFEKKQVDTHVVREMKKWFGKI